MTYDGRIIANEVLDAAELLGIRVSNLSLQKLIFFCHAWHLVDTGEPLIKNQFEAWEHGPVLQYIYRQFKSYGSETIESRARKLDPMTGRNEIAAGYIDEETKARIRRVVEFYGQLEPWDLVDLSHIDGGPWDQVWNGTTRINPGMKISHDSVRDFYSSALEGRPVQ